MLYYDQKARADFQRNKNSVIGWILISSYTYYFEAYSLLSDECFDGMMKYALENWEELTHIYKSLIDKDDLRAGTLYTLKREVYPNGMKQVAEKLMRDL